MGDLPAEIIRPDGVPYVRIDLVDKLREAAEAVRDSSKNGAWTPTRDSIDALIAALDQTGSQ